MANIESEQLVKDYYSKNIFYYNRRHLHYPIWDETTTKYADASINTSKVVVDELHLKDGDKVLDAGCGVGGTSIYAAESHNVEVTGITIVPAQRVLAERYAAESPARKRLRFLLRDYTDTGFKDQSYDKIYGIESICYAIDKRDFLKEAYRILKPGGRIAILDAYRVKKDLNKKESKVYQDFLDGFVLDNLPFQEQFHKDMEDIGFKDVKFESKNVGVRKTLGVYYFYGTVMYPFVYLLQKFGLISDSLGHVISARNSKFLIENDVLVYGVFTGVKR